MVYRLTSVEIRPPKSTGVTIEDTEQRIFLARENLLLQKCVQEQHTKGTDHRSACLSVTWWGHAPFIQMVGAQFVHDWKMLHLELRSSVNKNQGLQVAKMVTHFDGFPYRFPLFLFSVLFFKHI
jgi:hypothetical protein